MRAAHWRPRLRSIIPIAVCCATTAGAATVALDPGDLSPGDNFGQAVAISGDTAVVSAHQAAAAAGAVYVFVKQGGTWSLQQKLVPDDGNPDDVFGTFVAIDGDSVIVGAPQHASQSGAAYVFVRGGSTWSQQQKLVAADGEAQDRFGIGVAISGDTVVVGASGDDDVAVDAGAAYTFTRSGGVWSPQQKLTVPAAAGNDRIGSDVALDGETAVVSAPLDDQAGPDSGAAYVFARAGGVWALEAKLVAADSLAGELVASAVALSGDTAVLGAHYGFAEGTVTGAAYVFVRSGGVWDEQQKLTAFDGTAPDDFGWAVDIAGDVAIGGGDADDETAGSAHVYVRKDGAWYHRQELPGPIRESNFGYSVAASVSSVVVGASRGAGAAYVFDIDATLAHPLAGSRVTIKNRLPDDERRNRLNVTLQGESYWLPVPWSSSDPTIAGAVVRIESQTSGQVYEQILPAANWQRRGTGQAKASYRYSDRELDDGACKTVRVSGRTVKLVCTGKGLAALGYDLVAGQPQAPLRVTVEFAPGVGYCAEFGGAIGSDGSDGESFSAKDAPPPPTCE